MVSYVLLFFFLLFLFNFNIFIPQAPDKLIASCVPNSSGETSNPICIPAKTAYKLLWYCSAWPPFVWFLFVGNLIALIAVRKKYKWYHDIQWSRYETKLKKKMSQQWENSTQRKARADLETKRKETSSRNYKRKELSKYTVCVCCKCWKKIIPKNSARFLRGPCVCQKQFIYQIVLFISSVVVPLSVLLPVWIVAAWNDTDMSMEVNNEVGKTIWISCFMAVPIIYFILTLYEYYRLQQVQQKQLNKIKKRNKKRRKENFQESKTNKKNKKNKKNDDNNSSSKSKKNTTKENKDSNAKEEEEEKLENPDPHGRRVLRRSHWCTWNVLFHCFLFILFFLTPMLLG